jgi:hypothetical protein
MVVPTPRKAYNSGNRRANGRNSLPSLADVGSVGPSSLTLRSAGSTKGDRVMEKDTPEYLQRYHHAAMQCGVYGGLIVRLANGSRTDTTSQSAILSAILTMSVEFPQGLVPLNFAQQHLAIVEFGGVATSRRPSRRSSPSSPLKSCWSVNVGRTRRDFPFPAARDSKRRPR